MRRRDAPSIERQILYESVLNDRSHFIIGTDGKVREINANLKGCNS
jgi:peroxiredoxin